MSCWWWLLLFVDKYFRTWSFIVGSGGQMEKENQRKRTKWEFWAFRWKNHGKVCLKERTRLHSTTRLMTVYDNLSENLRPQWSMWISLNLNFWRLNLTSCQFSLHQSQGNHQQMANDLWRALSLSSLFLNQTKLLPAACQHELNSRSKREGEKLKSKQRKSLLR